LLPEIVRQLSGFEKQKPPEARASGGGFTAVENSVAIELVSSASSRPS
jgi:hypothetical protein